MDSLGALRGVVKKTKTELEKHIIECHDGRTYSCDVCQKKCHGKKGLLNHKQTHQLITCNICSKEFKTRSFNKHKKQCGVTSNHDDIKSENVNIEHKCLKCEYVSNTKSNLTRHQKICQNFK